MKITVMGLGYIGLPTAITLAEAGFEVCGFDVKPEVVARLNSGKIRGAGLDVYAEEPAKNEALLNHPNVSCTPHIGAATKEAQKRIGMEIVSIIDNL